MVQLKLGLQKIDLEVDDEFQFHNGTIKTQHRRTLSYVIGHFNSIMVQLKLSKANLNKEVNSFQFHNGTIKTAN